jgi:arylformamidase
MLPSKRKLLFAVAIGALVCLNGCVLLVRQAVAGPLREHADAQDLEGMLERAKPVDTTALPAGIRIVRDVAYGSDARQRFDVYAPAHARNAPVIFMVHGGGWFRGDKNMAAVVENKVRRWLPRGFIVISVDNRLVPQANPVEQADDIAHALATAQDKVAQWGGDQTKFVLMGHSAGAHLIALLTVSPALARNAGAAPWLGSVLLDSGALDVPQIMQARHFALFDKAFGKDPVLWKAASPFDALTAATQPILAVCSSRREISCRQADAFSAKARRLGSRSTVLREDLSHGDINFTLGQSNAYTDSVETFMRSLDPGVAKALDSGQPAQE